MIESDVRKEKLSLSAVVYGIYCALLPLNMILNFTGFTINKYVGIVASGLFFVEMVRYHQFRVNREYIIFFLFLVWSSVTIVWSIDDSATFGALNTLFNLVMLTMLVLIRGFNCKEMTGIKYFMIIPSALIFFYLAPNLNVSYTRLTLQTSAGAADQNSLAANLVFPLLMAIDETKYRKNKFLKGVNILCAFLISMSLLLIASRGGILSATISLVVYFFLEGRKDGKNLTSTILIRRLIVVLAIVGVANWVLRNVELPALTRLQFSAITSDKGMGRIDIWRSFWRAIWDNPIRHLFGYGYGTETSISRQFLGQTIGAHNVYLEHWATIGLIGFIILLMMFYRPLHHAINKHDSLGVACMIALIVACLPLGFLSNKGAWNIMLLSFVGFQDHESTMPYNDGEMEHLESWV